MCPSTRMSSKGKHRALRDGGDRRSPCGILGCDKTNAMKRGSYAGGLGCAVVQGWNRKIFREDTQFTIAPAVQPPILLWSKPGIYRLAIVMKAGHVAQEAGLRNCYNFSTAQSKEQAPPQGQGVDQRGSRQIEPAPHLIFGVRKGQAADNVARVELKFVLILPSRSSHTTFVSNSPSWFQPGGQPGGQLGQRRGTAQGHSVSAPQLCRGALLSVSDIRRLGTLLVCHWCRCPLETMPWMRVSKRRWIWSRPRREE